MTLLALILTGLGAILLYAAAPRQAWFARPLKSGPSRAAAAAALVAAFLLWSWSTTPATALFILMTLLMVLLAALPYLALARSMPAAR